MARRPDRGHRFVPVVKNSTLRDVSSLQVPLQMPVWRYCYFCVMFNVYIAIVAHFNMGLHLLINASAGKTQIDDLKTGLEFLSKKTALHLPA